MLEKIAESFFELEIGLQILDPDELIFVSNIEIEDKIFKTYFKRKTLKHFIERRKQDLQKRNASEKVLKIILKMLSDLPIALKEYTSLEINKDRNNSYLVYKDFKNEKTPVTIVLEKSSKQGCIIISYYFTKR